MSNAPQPILGLDTDPVLNAQQQTKIRIGRVAMAMAIIAVILTVKALFTSFPQGNQVRLTLFFGILLQAVALGLGIYSRRTKSGKAAILITVFFYLGALLLVIVARSIKF